MHAKHQSESPNDAFSLPGTISEVAVPVSDNMLMINKTSSVQSATTNYQQQQRYPTVEYQESSHRNIDELRSSVDAYPAEERFSDQARYNDRSDDEEEKSNNHSQIESEHYDDNFRQTDNPIEFNQQQPQPQQQIPQYIPDSVLGGIYEFYNDIYLMTFLFSLILLGSFLQIISSVVLFAYFLLVALYFFNEKIQAFKVISKEAKEKRKQCFFAILEIVLTLVFQVYLYF